MTNYDALQEGSSTVMGKIMEQAMQHRMNKYIKAALRETPETSPDVLIRVATLGETRTLMGMGWELIAVPAGIAAVYHLKRRRAEVEQDLLSAAA